MTGLVDRAAVSAGWVGVGVAVTLALSFLLIIPIEPIYWLLALPAGLLIGYYANSKAGRPAGQWARILANGVFAGAVTGLALAALLLGIKAIFFYADSGYPAFNRVDQTGQLVPPLCDTGRDCVWSRYEKDRPTELRAAGIADPVTFERLYWAEQLAMAVMLQALALAGGLGGAALYGTSRPKGIPAVAGPSAQR